LSEVPPPPRVRHDTEYGGPDGDFAAVFLNESLPFSAFYLPSVGQNAAAVFVLSFTFYIAVPYRGKFSLISTARREAEVLPLLPTTAAYFNDPWPSPSDGSGELFPLFRSRLRYTGFSVRFWFPWQLFNIFISVLVPESFRGRLRRGTFLLELFFSIAKFFPIPSDENRHSSFLLRVSISQLHFFRSFLILVPSDRHFFNLFFFFFWFFANQGMRPPSKELLCVWSSTGSFFSPHLPDGAAGNSV